MNNLFTPGCYIERRKNKTRSIVFLIICLIFLCDMTTIPARADMVSVARSQIGKGEIGGNNKGIYIRQYLSGREGLPWCAGFVSYCARRSGLNIPYTLRAKDFLKLGKRVRYPQPGDLILFSRKGGGHVGIVSEVYKNDNIIVTIEGNLGSYPSKVKEVHHKLGHIKNFSGFVRLEKKQNENPLDGPIMRVPWDTVLNKTTAYTK